MKEAAPSTPLAEKNLEAWEDSELLRQYVHAATEEAFAVIVRRRIGLVYSVALRQTRGDRHRAQDVCQTVFTDLARKAATLLDRPTVLGWLYRSAQFAAAGLVRAEQRRQQRENTAHLMHDVPGTTEPDWEKVRPVLDEALGEMDERDRDLILLRFFDEKPFAEIGSRLRLTENAARMRVERALDRLAAALGKRGINSTSAALGVALGQQVGAATPAGLAATVTGAALAQASGAGGWLAGVMGMSNVQAGIVGLIAIAGGTGFVVQSRANAALRSEIAQLQAQEPVLAALRLEHGKLTDAVAELEQLRRDDEEFKRLADGVAELKRANEEQARVARARATQQAQEVQAEIDRLNREGNALVGQYKELAARAKDLLLTTEQRAAAEAASKLKLTEIQAKQREVQAFIAAARAANPQLELPSLDVRNSVAGEVTARKAKAAEMESARGDASSPAGGEQVSVRLPNVDVTTALAVLEKIAGTRIARDPSLNSVRGTMNFQTDKVPKADAVRSITAELAQQLNVDLETAPDGALTAKAAAPGWGFRAR